MKNIASYPHRFWFTLFVFVIFCTIPLSAFVIFVTYIKGTGISAANPTIDISAEAIQKPHLVQVPHTDSNGNFKTSVDADSFFPIGIYNPTLCRIGYSFFWQEGPQTPGWNGEYRIKVHYGDNRNPGSYLLSDINIGSGLGGTVGNLPGSSNLYYSIWLNRTNVVIKEGTFTTAPCTSSENNNYASIKNAGFNTAILEKNYYPDANVLTKAQENNLKLLLDVRDRPNGTFNNLKDNPNVLGFYVGDDDLARVWATGGDPTTVYNDLNSFADGLDTQTGKVILAAEPDIYSDQNQSWKNWYIQFDSIGNVSFHYNYPKTFTSNTIKTQVDAVKNQILVNGSSRPSWFISQAINLKWVFPLDFPTAQEAKALAYSAVIHGATGIFQFSYDGWLRRQPKGSPAPENLDDVNWYDRHAGIKANTPYNYSGNDKWVYTPSAEEILKSIALWNALDASQNGVNKELSDLKNIILTKTSSEEYKVFVDSRPISTAPIRTILKYYNGDYYLLAVNIDAASINAKFEFPGKNLANPGYLFQSGIPNVVGDEINQQFSPYGVYVFKFKISGPDSDGDGISDMSDNCPSIANANQANFNSEIVDLGASIPYDDETNPLGDNLGNVCDDDMDHDRLSNQQEVSLGTNPLNPDTDGDRDLDGAEVICSANPQDVASTIRKPAATTLPDQDKDRLPDSCESLAGSNPSDIDTDDDKLQDGAEFSVKGTSVNNVDTDGDSCTDAREVASVNGDRAINVLDLQQIAPRVNGAYHANYDFDGNGTINVIDLKQVADLAGNC